MDDIADQFFIQVDHNKLRIKNLPNFIFLCGGNPSLESLNSMRALLQKHIMAKDGELSARIRLAEDHQDWTEHGKVSNLIDLELILADMAGAIILVLEGVGAYAELGSFSVMGPLSKKLILIVNTNIILEDTFVNLGPIKYLEDNKSHVFKYSWDVYYKIDQIKPHVVTLELKQPKDDANRVTDLIYGKIKKTIPKMKLSTTKLDTKRTGHLCFIVAELIYVFSALTFNELKKYLFEYFGYRDINARLIKTTLYILENFDFVHVVHVGETFYVPKSQNRGFIKYAFEPSVTESTNSAELKNTLIAHYAEHDEERYAAMLRN